MPPKKLTSQYCFQFLILFFVHLFEVEQVVPSQYAVPVLKASKTKPGEALDDMVSSRRWILLFRLEASWRGLDRGLQPALSYDPTNLRALLHVNSRQYPNDQAFHVSQGTHFTTKSICTMQFWGTLYAETITWPCLPILFLLLDFLNYLIVLLYTIILEWSPDCSISSC